jgi:hypothetical protein
LVIARLMWVLAVATHDHHAGGDLVVGHAAGRERHHLTFPVGQHLQGGAPVAAQRMRDVFADQPTGDRGGEQRVTAALILFLAFTALAGVPVADVQIFATALAAGIIIDATLVRGMLTPALITLLARANWWWPGATRGAATVPAAVAEERV